MSYMHFMCGTNSATTTALLALNSLAHRTECNLICDMHEWMLISKNKTIK